MASGMMVGMRVRTSVRVTVNMISLGKKPVGSGVWLEVPRDVLLGLEDLRLPVSLSTSTMANSSWHVLYS